MHDIPSDSVVGDGVLRENRDGIEEAVLQHTVDISERSGDEIAIPDDFLRLRYSFIFS